MSARGIKVLAGFGVKSRSQVQLLAPHIHSVIAGTCLVQAIKGSLLDAPESLYQRVRKKVEELIT